MAESSSTERSYQDPGRHSHRIRWTAHGADIVLLAFALFGLFWLFFRLLLCTGAVEQGVCRQSYTVPSGMAILLLLALVLMLHFLRLFGHELEQTGKVERSRHTGLRRVGNHVRHGYRHLDEGHRAHVRRSVLWVGTVASAIIATLLFFWIVAMPPLLAIVIGAAGALGTHLSNQRWLV